MMKMLLGGKEVGASDGASFDVINPATLEVIDRVPSATDADVETALQNAVSGAKKWRDVPLYKRIDVIQKFREIYLSRREELWKLLQSETGKTIGAASGCVDGSAALCEHYIELSRTLGGETFPMGNRPDTDGCVMYTIRQPLGVVLVILPFNFPVDAYMHKVIPALLMGNSVIIKIGRAHV